MHVWRCLRVHGNKFSWLVLDECLIWSLKDETYLRICWSQYSWNNPYSSDGYTLIYNRNIKKKHVWLIKEQIKVDTTIPAILSKNKYKQVIYPLHSFPDVTTILKVRNKIVDSINLVLNLQNNSITDIVFVSFVPQIWRAIIQWMW